MFETKPGYHILHKVRLSQQDMIDTKDIYHYNKGPKIRSATFSKNIKMFIFTASIRQADNTYTKQKFLASF